MASTSNEDESFIILGPSSTNFSLSGLPSSLMELDVMSSSMQTEGIPTSQPELKPAVSSINSSLPSISSMMIASNMISENESKADIQMKFGELIDENITLKETLKKEKDSMKEKLLVIASCQEDLLGANKIHKQKFEETKEFLEKLKAENRYLKMELLQKSQSSQMSDNSNKDSLFSNLSIVSHPRSPFSFTEPADLPHGRQTANSSIENHINITKSLLIQEDNKAKNSHGDESIKEFSKSSNTVENITNQENIVFNKQQLSLNESIKNTDLVESEDKGQSSSIIHEKENHDSSLLEFVVSPDEDTLNKLTEQLNLIEMQRRQVILENEKTTWQKESLEQLVDGITVERNMLRKQVENMKLNMQEDVINTYKDQIAELQTRIKETQSLVFQPKAIVENVSYEESSIPEYRKLASNVTLYNRALRRLAELLHVTANNSIDNVSRALDLVVEIEKSAVNQSAVIKEKVSCLKNCLLSQQKCAADNACQLRAAVSAFDGIFLDYEEVLKQLILKCDEGDMCGDFEKISLMTSALLSRGEEVESAEEEIARLRLLVNTLQRESDEREALKAQADVYRSDFMAEVTSKERAMLERDSAIEQLRATQQRNEQLTAALEEVRKLNPNIFNAATSGRARQPGRQVKRHRETEVEDACVIA